jgi:hypothetical protein
MIQFGEWLPDQTDFGVPISVAQNVLPAARGYRSVNNLATLSGAADDRLRKVFAAKDNTGSTHLFAGDGTKLYKFNTTTSALDNVSKAGNYTLGAFDNWQVAQFGRKLIVAGDTGETLQFWELGSSTAFADISGSPSARYVTVVRDFVVTGYVTNPYRVQWSAIGDETSWTVGTNQADFQDIADLGAVTGLVGGEYGVALMEKGISRFSYIGDPLIFQFDNVETARGMPFEGGYAAIGPSQIYYLSDDGFYLFNGQNSVPIGSEKVNKWFYDNLNIGFAERINCSLDPVNQIVAWGFPSQNSGDGTPDTILFYNYAVNRWSTAEITHDVLGTFFTAASTLEALDNISSSIDGLDTTLDSRLFKGGTFTFGGAKDNKIASFTASPLTATLTTGENKLVDGRLSNVTKIVPYFTNGTISAEIGTRNSQADTVSFTSSSALNDDGFLPSRAVGRYHRMRFTLSGAWKELIGYDLEVKPLGQR